MLLQEETKTKLTLFILDSSISSKLSFLLDISSCSDGKIEEFSLFSKTMEQNVQRLIERCQSYGLKFDGGKLVY